MARYKNITRDDAREAADIFYKAHIIEINADAKSYIDRGNEIVRNAIYRWVGKELFNILEDNYIKFSYYNMLGNLRPIPMYQGICPNVENSSSYYGNFSFINFTKLDIARIFPGLTVTQDEAIELAKIESYLRGLLSYSARMKLEDTIYECRTRKKLEQVLPEAVNYINWVDLNQSERKRVEALPDKTKDLIDFMCK